MSGRPERVRLVPFLAGAAVGSLLGVVVGALLSAPVTHVLAELTDDALERLFGRRDEELRFELLLQ